MRKSGLAAAAASVAILAAPGAQAEPSEFAGLYAGAHAGYIDMDTRFTGGSGPDDGGSLGGVQVGYNLLSGNVIWGVEADYSLTDVDPEGTCPFGTSINCDIDITGLATLRARAGYASGDWLFYVTGGVAAMHLDVVTSGPAGTSRDDEGEFGWTAGAGIEYLVGAGLPGPRNVGLKLEYRYLSIGDFGEADIDSPSGGGGTIDIDLHSHIFLLGVNWHF